VSAQNTKVPLTDDWLTAVASAICAVQGMVGVVLGGSRARGEHLPSSDFDVGLYYRADFDLDGLRQVAREVAGAGALLTGRGEWGPWVDGGGWLTIAGHAVDWLYRDLDRVEAVWLDAVAGRYGFHAQVGHPFGFADFGYVGELALSHVLVDPSGRLEVLRRRSLSYPPKLKTALVGRLWEAHFSIANAHKALPRGDTAYVASCLFRAMLLCAHALHAHDGKWLINEKGAIKSAGCLIGAPPGFAVRAQNVLSELGTTSQSLARAIDAAERVVADTEDACHNRT
jgi:hypothetical protein